MRSAPGPESPRPRLADIVPLGPGVSLRCPACRYDLADATLYRCPECGESFTLDDIILRERPAVWLWAAWYAICGTLALPGALLLLSVLHAETSRGAVLAASVPLSIGGLPIAAMLLPSAVLPGWRGRGGFGLTKFVILLWPLLCPALWLLGASLYLLAAGYS